jgi:hypothetical protein
MNEQLHNPPWANEWIVDQARKHRIDAAIVLVPLGTRPAATGRTSSNSPWRPPVSLCCLSWRTWWIHDFGMRLQPYEP